MTMTSPTRHATPADTLLTDSSGGSDYWQLGGVSTGEINLRAEIEKILRERGHYVFFRRASNTRAPGWDDDARENVPDQDPFSWNGYLYQDELVRTRFQPTYDEASGIAQLIRNPMGFWSASTFVAWLPYDVKPTIRDGIVEVTLDADGLPRVPYNIENCYAIRYAHPYRDQNGRIEFWSVILEKLTAGK